MRNYKPYTSYKLLPEEQQLPVLYKLTRQEGILFAYAVEDDTHRVKRGDGETEWNDLPYEEFGLVYLVTYSNLSGEVSDNEKLQDELEKLANENFNFDCLGFDDSVFDGFIDDEANDDKVHDKHLKENFTLCIECNNESELQKLYDDFKDKGYKCKIITF